ncbi:hypothetical protein RQM47_07465 [Rubrivirga sp. S365]|uniref:AP2 domain-containing protein n=1 Tax=Rubrivirga litoralis TaxID=3075598 RepID=A0ABU3BRB7_9BACT|nr:MULTISPECIES: hypothetical protein [unclassified Rubrivirga]MDT0631834.1 hypothetical protein [Rubrivirga sp. F394]MDT7856474.1 hypothetical protein [Rubrivirga sp. S365]
MTTTDTDMDLFNITRLDHVASWWVRLQRDGEKIDRRFRDRDHGGTDGALAAAQAWREAQIERLGPTPPSKASHMLTPEARRRNRRAVTQTGVTGIGVTVKEFSASSVPYVTAYWIDGAGRRRQTSFSAGRHGVDGALRLAAKARAQTTEWHGEPARTADELYEAAEARVRELVEAA